MTKIRSKKSYAAPTADVAERVRALAAEAEAAVDACLSSLTVTPDELRDLTELVTNELSDLSFCLRTLNASDGSEITEKAHEEVSQVLSGMYSRMSQDERARDAYQRAAFRTDLTPAQRKHVNDALRAFKASGVGLPADKKSRLREIRSELTRLCTAFTSALVKGRKSFKLGVSDPEDVRGMPEDLLAEHANPDGSGWTFTLLGPCYSAVMEHCPSRNVRESMYRASVTMAPENEEVIDSILRLRQEAAAIIGYGSPAECTLSMNRVAVSTEAVGRFLSELGDACAGPARAELSTVIEFARRSGYDGEFAVYDSPYWTARYARETLGYDAEEYRPYLELGSVLDAAFGLFGDMFGLRFEKASAPAWHDTVIVYDVFEEDGTPHARLYVDPYARETKRGGAWMDSWTTGYDDGVERVLPEVTVTCNFRQPREGSPSMLTPDEASTVLHEMGHALQHTCSSLDSPDYSGIDGVEWDAVEWASQLMECFLYERVFLDRLRHAETGAALPSEMRDRLVENRNYAQARQMLRQVEMSEFDMAVHSLRSVSAGDVQREMDRSRKRRSILDCPSYNRFQCQFSHIFAGGYASGYYSYKWSELMSVDSFEHTMRRAAAVGLRKACQELRDSFLSRGSSAPSIEYFVDLVGREPDPTALLRHYSVV